MRSTRSSPRTADSERYVFKAHERPLLPGSPASPDHPAARRLAYLVIGALIAMTGGLNNALVSANLPAIQGALGLEPAQTAWLPTVYVMTNVSASLLLLKFRQQFGLAAFARIFLPTYAVVTLGHLLATSFATVLVVRALSGVSASALSALGLLYIVQAMPTPWRLKGIVLGVGVPQLAIPFARMFSAGLLENGEWHLLYRFELGLALLCAAGVAALPLPPSERIKTFEPLDSLSFALYASGAALLCMVLGLGRVLWWTEARWLGFALAGSVGLLTMALTVEHMRANPLLNTRWLGSADILRFAAVATAVRLLLAEQNSGALGLLTALGFGPEQCFGLYATIALATAAGIATSALTIEPTRLGPPIAAALLMIASGALLDARSGIAATPGDFHLSQALISFAAVLFLGPVLLSGILRAVARGPNHVVSFSALFSMTQSLGGLAGAAALGSFQVVREHAHLSALAERIAATEPLLQGQALAGRVALEARVYSYDDVFVVVGCLALVTLVLLVFRMVRVRMRSESPLSEALATIAQAREGR